MVRAKPEPTQRLVVGLQPVREAIRVHGSGISSVLVDSRPQPQLAALARFAQDQGIARVERVRRSALDRMSGGTSHQGAAAWAPPLSFTSLSDILPRPDLLAVALDQIQDPQNFGAVLRSGVVLGRAPIIWGEHSSAPLSAATFRASAGAVEHATLCRTRSLAGALGQAADRGIQVVGLEPRAKQLLHEVRLTGPTILVIGSEHQGLGRAVKRRCTELASLTPPGPVDSLNASAAAALALYEAVIQRLSSSG